MDAGAGDRLRALSDEALRDRLVRVLRAKFRDWHLVEDAVQEAYVAALSHPDPVNDLFPWLYVVARYRLLNELRSKYHRTASGWAKADVDPTTLAADKPTRSSHSWVECFVCGKRKPTSTDPPPLYCSRKCADLVRAARAEPQPCVVCHKPFRPTQVRQQCCGSDECRKAMRRAVRQRAAENRKKRLHRRQFGVDSPHVDNGTVTDDPQQRSGDNGNQSYDEGWQQGGEEDGPTRDDTQGEGQAPG